MTEEEFLNIESSDDIKLLLKQDLVKIYKKYNPDAPGITYTGFLNLIQGGAYKILPLLPNSNLDDKPTFSYAHIDTNRPELLRWNIYSYYVDKVLTKEKNPEYWL